MITRYCIKGFRSLLDFTIGLKPGINVLIGPNGSGKTNFIDFLDFVSNFVQSNASSAISSLGGTSRVFCIEQSDRKNNLTISGSIESFAQIDTSFLTRNKDNLRVFSYKYEFEIKFSKKYSTLYVSKESIMFRQLCDKIEETANAPISGILTIQRSSPSVDTQPKLTISNKLAQENERNPLFYRRSMSSKREINSIITESDPSVIERDESLFALRLPFYAIDSVRRSIVRGNSFNISPSRAKLADGLLQNPNILSDGRGLSATLYMFQELKNRDLYTCLTHNSVQVKVPQSNGGGHDRANQQSL